MSLIKDILIIVFVIFDIAVFITAIVATINGYFFLAIATWILFLCIGFLLLPTEGGYGSYDSDF